MFNSMETFKPSLNENHQAEKERYWRNQKNTVKRTLGLCTTLCVCVDYIYILLFVIIEEIFSVCVYQDKCTA